MVIFALATLGLWGMTLLLAVIYAAKEMLVDRLARKSGGSDAR
jgi:hypothetical protein